MSTCAPVRRPARAATLRRALDAEVLFRPADEKAWSQTGSRALDKLPSRKRSRVERLRKFRFIFGIASVLWLGVAIACVVFRLPYEPAAAMACCFSGIFTVFAMKVKDAAR